MAEKKSKNIEQLNKEYTDADQADQDIFAEYRSNLLLIHGEHYNKKFSRHWQRIRDNRNLTQEQKLRLTKNHFQRIYKTWVNNLITSAPGVMASPKNEVELQDQKAAELHQAVLADAKDRLKLNRRIRKWAEQFVGIGEVATKCFWDPMAGPLVGYEQEVGNDGTPLFDEQGQPVSSGKPIYKGSLTFEDIYGFNLLRSADAQTMDESPFLIVRKMVDMEVLKSIVPEDKQKWLENSKGEAFLVFENSSLTYKRSDSNMVLLREHYYRPCQEYPEGHYFITVQAGILFEGGLPFGEFPIRYASMDDTPTHARGHSILKQLRAYQVEINRTSSKIAEHQITLGDDKVWVQAGTTATEAANLPGVRVNNYTGQPPIIQPGRDGSQYIPFLQNQISEMYEVGMVAESAEADNNGDVDPFTMLFKSAKQKKQYKLTASKFEDFLVDTTELFLRLAKKYYTDDMIIYAAGRRERINIAEFRSADDLCYQIKLEPQTDDIETKMGRQIALSQILQYVGQQLDKETLGQLIRNMPYGNLEEGGLSDLTLDYDNAKNDILMLDRGEMPQPNQYDNHQYVIKRLVNRMKQADFRFLSPQIQQNYAQYLQIHEQIEAEQQAQIAAAKSEYIPSGGYLVGVDFYIAQPEDPNKTRRARIPSQAVEWLIQKLDAQGMSLEKLESIQQAALSDIARMSSGQSPQPGPQGQGPTAPMEGSPNGNANVSTPRTGKPVLRDFESAGGAVTRPTGYGIK